MADILIETEKSIVVDSKQATENKIILYNDDVNTFDFVIETLVKVCGHELLQAEQCAYLVHYTGKCDVKNGTYKELKPLCSALLDRGLTAEII